MTTRRMWSLLLLVGLLAPAGFYFWRSDAETVEDSSHRTAHVSIGAIQRTVIATGVIRPVVGAEINVGSRISGTVEHLPVKIGDRVEKGQLLAELDSTALRSALDEARAELALNLPRVELAESTLRRRQKLADQGLLAGEDLEVAISDLAVERTRLEASQARVRSAEIVLGYAKITAPINGVIAEVSTREGETVAAGFSSPTFVTIVDLDQLEVLAYVDETDIGRIFVGQSATFTVDTFPDDEFSATVIAIQPKAEIQGSVINYVVRLDFEPHEGLTLRPEMTAHIRLLLEARDGILTAPRNTLRRRSGQQYVVVERDGQWIEQEVQTGWRSDTAVEIINGLREGDTLEINPE